MARLRTALIAFTLSCSDAASTSTDTAGTEPPDADAPEASETIGVLEDASSSESDADGSSDVEEGTDTLSTASVLDFDPAKAGPYHSGYRTWSHEYDAPAVGKRSIDLHVWYPTDVVKGEHPLYEGIFEDPAAVIGAAPVLPVDGKAYPVIVYSHGNQGFGGSSAFLARHFASHGFVVVAPEHTGNSLDDYIDPRPKEIWFLRSTDVTAALTALDLAVGDGDSTLSDFPAPVDVSRTVLIGHSFGAHTCWASAGATFASEGCADCSDLFRAIFLQGLRDARILGIIPMAGTLDRSWFGATGHESVSIPIFAMSGSADPVGADAQFEACDALDLTWIDIAGACHLSFAVGACDTLEEQVGFDLISRYALAFIRQVLFDDPSVESVLSGSTPLSRKVTLLRTTGAADPE